MITVALVHYESPDLARACVDSVRRFPPAEDYEIVIVDNASSTAARAVLDTIDVDRVVDSGRNGGFAFGVNRCVEVAAPESDVVVLVNPDTEVRDGSSLDRLVCEARRPGTALAAPTLFNAQGKRERSFHRRFPSFALVPLLVSAPLGIIADRIARIVGRHPFELSASQLQSGVAPAHVMGAVMAIPRRAWELTGPFDEAYFLYLEETEWQGRAGALGLVVRPAPDAEFMHLHRGGALEGAVPSDSYLDSLQQYLVNGGSRPWAVETVVRLSLASSVAGFAVLRAVTAVAFRSRRPLAEAGLRSAVRGLRSRRRASSGD